MSIKVMSHVWEHSQQKGSYLVTMLALADYAHDDGTRAYPSIATLARKTRMTERNVQLVLRKLEADGEILIHANAGPHGCNMFTILLNRPVISPPKKEGEKISGAQNMLGRGCKIPSEGDVKITPNPSLDPSKRKDPGISSFASQEREKARDGTSRPPLPALDPARVSPYALTPEIHQAQCASNQGEVCRLMVTIWPEEVAAREVLRQREAEALHRHPHTEIIHGSCTVCGEILEPAADEEPVR